MELTMELLAQDMLALQGDLEITDEKARYATEGFSADAAHLVVIEACWSPC